MSIFAICTVAIVTVVLTLTIKKQNAEISFLVAVLGCIFILLSICTATVTVFDKIKQILQISQINEDYLYILIKSIGICFIAEFCIDCCKDAGQNALANNVSIAGKIMVLITALPLFEDILNFALNIIGG